MLAFALLSSVVLLCRIASAKLTNYTLDDASPSVQYSNMPILRCSPSTCPESWTSQLFNGTSTLTQSSIVVPFTGTELYVFLIVSDGPCIIEIDGDTVGEFNNSPGNGSIQLAYRNTSIAAGTHRLMILPAHPETIIEFDYIIYANNVKRKAPIGAIVGGVCGAVALFAAVIVGIFLLRRREVRRKIFVRGLPLSDDDKSSINIKMIPRVAKK
ncbi:hypothetical protein B0H16DRAFT_1881902 [Mycena metata]|uniref:Uncharacterized protein n=1 Tax=Mycena metata TaxID=1033252 RepID=A0AAD7JPZ4_9AGAR|nr:hypothetical protein B0H16DRAFT_1881902 [Mycena metata]